MSRLLGRMWSIQVASTPMSRQSRVADGRVLDMMHVYVTTTRQLNGGSSAQEVPESFCSEACQSLSFTSDLQKNGEASQDRVAELHRALCDLAT